MTTSIMVRSGGGGAQEAEVNRQFTGGLIDAKGRAKRDASAVFGYYEMAAQLQLELANG